MSRNIRQWGVEEKLRILEEARAPGTTVAEVLGRHGIDGATYYPWEMQVKEGMRQALSGKPRSRGAKDREIERLKNDVQKMAAGGWHGRWWMRKWLI